MIIRDFREDDYQEVVDLLVAGNVEPPVDIGELAGICLLAIKEDEIIGVLYALAGASTKAYLDFMAIKEGHRGGFVYWRLMMEMDKRLTAIGVKRCMFHLEKHNHKALAQLYKHRERLGVIKLNDLHYFLREIPA